MRSSLVMGMVAASILGAACGGISTGDDGGDSRDSGGSAGTSNGGGTSGDPNWAAVCARSAASGCSQWERCSPGLAAAVLPSDCARTYATECENAARLSGARISSSEYLACTEAFDRLSCDDWLYGGVSPSECEGLVGTRPSGAPCAESIQCASGACLAIVGCGVCETPARLGEDCLERSCEGGLECGGQATCIVPRYLGDACSPEMPCSVVLVCQAGVCAKAPGDGAVCAPSFPNCDILQNLVCNSDTGRCEPMPVPDVGEGCTEICAAGTVCNDAGICVPALREGDTCALDEGQGDRCDRQLECMNGVCARFDPATCG